MYASSFRPRPESSIAARIAEKDNNRVKGKDYLLPKLKSFYRRGRRDRRGNRKRKLSVFRSSVTLEDRDRLFRDWLVLDEAKTKNCLVHYQWRV
jgi:hypothetical protein